MAQTSNEHEIAAPERTLGLEEENVFLCVMFSSSELKRSARNKSLKVGSLFFRWLPMPEGLLDIFSILSRQQTQDLLAYGRGWRRRKSGGINPQSPVRSARLQTKSIKPARVPISPPGRTHRPNLRRNWTPRNTGGGHLLVNVILIVTKDLSTMMRNRVVSTRPPPAGVVIARFLPIVGGLDPRLFRFRRNAGLGLFSHLPFPDRLLSQCRPPLFHPGRTLREPGCLAPRAAGFIIRSLNRVVPESFSQLRWQIPEL